MCASHAVSVCAAAVVTRLQPASGRQVKALCAQVNGVAQGPRKSDVELPQGNTPEVSVLRHHTRKYS